MGDNTAPCSLLGCKDIRDCVTDSECDIDIAERSKMPHLRDSLREFHTVSNVVTNGITEPRVSIVDKYNLLYIYRGICASPRK